MVSDRRKFYKYGTPANPLDELQPLILTHTSSDRLKQYKQSWEHINAFRAKWESLRMSGDTARAESFEQRVHDCIDTARRAKQELIRSGIDCSRNR